MREQRGQSSVLLVVVIVCMTTCGVCVVVWMIVQVVARAVAQFVRVVDRDIVRAADRLAALPAGKGQQPVRQGLALLLATGDDHDGVVTGDGPENVRLVSMVESGRQVVGCA